MTNTFDPYFLWLGIPPRDQPPNYYRLLGLELFESNPEAICHAADARMAYIRSFHTGPHTEWSQRLLHEIADAKVCLLSPEKKTHYDAQLRLQLSGRPFGTSGRSDGPPRPMEVVGGPPLSAAPIPVAGPATAGGLPPMGALPPPPPPLPQKSSVAGKYLAKRTSREVVVLGISVFLAATAIVLAAIFLVLHRTNDSSQGAHRAKTSNRLSQKTVVAGGKGVRKQDGAQAASDEKTSTNPTSRPVWMESGKRTELRPAPVEEKPKQSPPETPPFSVPSPPSQNMAGNPLSQQTPMRIWRDQTGKEFCQGRFEELRGNLVELVDWQGKHVTFPIQNFGDEDQKILDGILESRGQILFLLLSAVPVTKTMETSSLFMASIPIEENREGKLIGVFTQQYQLEEEVPISSTLEQLKTGLSYFLQGRSLRLKANINRVRAGDSLVEFDLSEAFTTSGISKFWNASFRNAVKIPAAFQEGKSPPQVGDQIYFQGTFDLTIEACPKCGGAGVRSCPECLNGFKQKTVLKERILPDGKKLSFPAQIQIPCDRCMGMAKIPCDHYVAPKPWNPATPSDKARSVIGQLRFSRAELLKNAKVDPWKLPQIRLNLARDAAYALCFHLKEMEVGLISRGEKKVILHLQKAK